MKSLRSLITLAAMMVVAATTLFTSSVAAAGYETRMPLTADQVTGAEDQRWNDLAEKIVGERPFAANAELEEAPLPTLAVGKMFGGAWGEGGGYEPMRLVTKGWKLFQFKKEVPGVMVTLDSGMFLHAELGDGGTAFLFVGIATTATAEEAIDEAAFLDSLLNKDGEYWERFETAVANTTAIKNLQDADIALATRVENLERKTGVPVGGGAGASPEPKPAAGGAGASPKDKPAPAAGKGEGKPDPKPEGGKEDKPAPADGKGGVNYEILLYLAAGLALVIAAAAAANRRAKRRGGRDWWAKTLDLLGLGIISPEPTSPPAPPSPTTETAYDPEEIDVKLDGAPDEELDGVKLEEIKFSPDGDEEEEPPDDGWDAPPIM